jgi:hypothetical protein
MCGNMGIYLRQRKLGMWYLENDFLVQAELVVAATAQPRHTAGVAQPRHSARE